MDVYIDDKELEKLYTTGQSKKLILPEQVIDKFLATIQKIESAVTLSDLWADKGLRFEKLRGTANRYSMRLTGKYRLEMEVTWMDEKQTIGKFYLKNNIKSLRGLKQQQTKIMVQTTELKAAKKFGPGYFIREQMEMRDWTQDDLSEVTGFTVKHLNKILQDKQPLTLDMARVLGQVFNTSAQYWINIDTGYRLWLSQEKTEEEIEADIKGLIYERMPVKDMLSKGWLQPFDNAEELKQQVLEFWGWEKLDFSILDKDYLPCLTRKSEAYNQFNASYAVTWYRKALNEATNYKVSSYKKPKLEKLYNNIHTYTTNDKGINQFIKELADAGVIFFVLPHLQKTYLDGAAFFADKNPVIVYTGRYKRIDNFWFTIAHEIAHILKHLNDEVMFVLDNLKDGVINKMENEANELAAEKLKHAEILEYLNPYLNYLTTGKVEECAAEYGIHPAIIIGKLAHEKKISYSNQSLYNENVLELIQKQYQVIN